MIHSVLFFFIVLDIMVLHCQPHIRNIAILKYPYPVTHIAFASPEDDAPAVVIWKEKEDEIPEVVEDISISDSPSPSLSEPTETDKQQVHTPSKGSVPDRDYTLLLKGGNAILLGHGEVPQYLSATTLITTSDYYAYLKIYQIHEQKIEIIDSVFYADSVTTVFAHVYEENHRAIGISVGLYGKKGKISTALFYDLGSKEVAFPHDAYRGGEEIMYASEGNWIFLRDNAQQEIITHANQKGFTRNNLFLSCKPGYYRKVIPVSDSTYALAYTCYSSRTTYLQLMDTSGRMIWQTLLNDYYENIVYQPTNSKFIGTMYSVPKSKFVSISAQDGKILKELNFNDISKPAPFRTVNWLVHFPTQLHVIPNSPFVLILNAMYSPQDRYFHDNRIILSDGIDFWEYPLAQNSPGFPLLKVMNSHRLFVTDGGKVTIMEIANNQK